MVKQLSILTISADFSGFKQKGEWCIVVVKLFSSATRHNNNCVL